MVEKVNNVLEDRQPNVAKTLNDETLELSYMREKLESFQNTIIKDVRKHIASIVDEIMLELQQQELQKHEFEKSTGAIWNNRILKSSQSDEQNKYNGGLAEGTDCNLKNNMIETNQRQQQKLNGLQVLPDKIFITRESYLTALLKVNHMRSIYHIFQIIFIVLFSHTILYDYFVEGKINFGLQTIKSGLRGIHYVLGIWLLQHVFVFSLYFAFQLWAYMRGKLQKQSSLQSFWSHSCLILYIASQLIFDYVPSVMCLKLNLSYVSSCVLLLESTRLLMKMHAFVRTNAERVLSGKLKYDEDISTTAPAAAKLPKFSWYLYFLFAPTLLYRDNYPRTSSISWKFVLRRFAEILTIAFLLAFLHERHMEPHFVNYGLEPVTAAGLIAKFFGMCMPGIMVFLCGFYLLFQAWLNCTAELLRFGDRMFYKDWWTAHNFDVFYRKWNVVVHDWLYEYIYKDVYNYIFHGSKTAALLTVFAVSALVHEHILCLALKSFLPIMFICFGFIGVLLIFWTRRASKQVGNVFIWFALISGCCVIMSFYYMEYFARKNCSLNIKDENWTDALVPMFWKCKLV